MRRLMASSILLADIYNSINNADDLTDIRNLINGMYGTGDSEVASENLGKAFSKEYTNNLIV